MAWVNTLPTPTGSSSSSTHAPARRSHISHLLGILAGYSLPVAHPIMSSTLPRFYRSLPIVDVGAHTGGDLIVPAALRGHRVYAYEPTPRTFHALVANLRRSNISFATKPRGFRNATAGTVLVRHAAVSDRSGFATLLQSPVYGGVANTLGGDAAMPASYLQGAYRRNVSTVRLDDELKEEVDGVFMLKIDSQGHEMSVLRGAEAYIRARPVYLIQLEFSPMGLKAAGVNPLDLLKFVSDDLGYQCFETTRNRGTRTQALSLSLEDFVAAYPAVSKRNKFGEWTDLLCARLDLVRRRARR